MHRFRALALAFGAALLLLLGLPSAADAHGFTTVVYVDASSPGADHVVVKFGLEYDLLLVSVADTQKDDPFYREGQPAWDDGDIAGMTAALEDHKQSVLGYVTQHFGIAYGGSDCAPTLAPDASVDINEEQGVPYAHIAIDFACEPNADADVLKDGHTFHSDLFASSEGYVKGAKTIVTYQLDDQDGTAALDENKTSFTTKQTWGQRFWEFYRLGAEHLLKGLDHLLFLTALIIGSRKLREIVLAATTFTLAHSTTLILAAFGVVHVTADVVEPLIALSIAATAAWYLWRVVRKREHATDLDVTSRSHFALDRAGWVRLTVVFGFGLIHGMGFAGALGIDHSWSWPLLWSLLIFNVGIETVQLGLIVLIFPVLMLLRHRAPTAALWITTAVALGVSVIGLIWFGQRVFGFELIGEGG
ncbi:HupE/UreJ family protein [Nocardioides sp. Kera G14]|uniref:HupE/UreJ family protein n=1 Tax=Nocardioides sp. Kera G14 TaxID=2884264 RepID=UPI001D12112D|nr:HupE/UreJ family protein [Nocardioides sp. Kera G14]UDY22621.1 HupE/UreJ family protein [Nocardioides sp. Kera G14]